MKPKLPAFPRQLVLTSSAVMAVFAPLGTFAADITWKGTNNSTWTDGSNWLLGSAPVYGGTFTTDRLVIANGTGSGAVYNPPAGETTTFESGRGIIIGSGTGNSANLTVTSGTLKINGPSTSGNEPIMANGQNATLLINGGHLDLSGHGNGFRLVNTGVTGLTSDLTISSGTFSCGTFDFFNAGVAATSTVNLNGGVMALSRFLKVSTTATSALNLDGGTLRARNTQTSPNVFLADLTGLQTIVEDGGVIVDTNTFNATILEVLEHDTTLGAGLDGGLTKNGIGTLTLSGINTFNGPVTLNAGTSSTTTSKLLLGSDSGAGTGIITFADSFTDLQLSVSRNIANPLVISDTGDQKTLIFVTAGSGECSGAITINETTVDNFRVRSDAGCFLTISGKISGAGKMTKIQSGDVSLTNGANDFTGGTKIDAGKLNYLYGALGASGNVTMNGGTLRWSPGNTQDLSARLVMVDTKTATYETGGNNVTFGTAIGNSSTANLAKTGSGTLTLTGTNSYTGTTTVNGGTLRVDGSLNAASLVSVTTGELSGIGAIGGSVTVAAAGNIVPRAVGFAGTLTMGGLDVAAMAAGTTGKLKFDLGANTAGSDKIAVTGALSIGTAVLGFSDFTFSNLTGGPQTGTYTLITSGAAVNGTLDGSDLSGTIGVGGTGTLAINGNDIVLTITGISSGYAGWQAANGPTTQTIDLDHDNDGISNGIEYFLGGNTNTTGFTALPAVVNTGGTLSITWIKAGSYTGAYNTDFVVETSATLASPWTAATLGAAPGQVVITGNDVKCTFPAGTRNFARLRVTGP